MRTPSPSFNLLVLRCNDIHKTKHFYEQLGLTFKKEQHGKGPVHFSSLSLGFVLELYPSSPTTPTDQTRLGFSFQSTQALPDFIVESFSEGETVIILHDPDQRKVEIRLLNYP